MFLLISAHLRGVEPDGIKRVKVEGGVGAVEHRPSPQLRRRESRYDDPRQLRRVQLRRGPAGGSGGTEQEDEEDEQRSSAPPPPLHRRVRDDVSEIGSVSKIESSADWLWE